MTIISDIRTAKAAKATEGDLFEAARFDPHGTSADVAWGAHVAAALATLAYDHEDARATGRFLVVDGGGDTELMLAKAAVDHYLVEAPLEVVEWSSDYAVEFLAEKYSGLATRVNAHIDGDDAWKGRFVAEVADIILGGGAPRISSPLFVVNGEQFSEVERRVPDLIAITYRLPAAELAKSYRLGRFARFLVEADETLPTTYTNGAAA